MSRSILLGAALLGALVARPAAAQLNGPRASTNPLDSATRIGIAVGGLYASPGKDLKPFVNRGFGAGGSFLFKLDPAGVLALRADANWVNYGNDRTRVPLAGSGGLISFDLNTSNNIFMGGIGLQLQAPSGPLRPYVGGTVGFATFWTQTSAEGSDNNNEPFATSTNQRDNTFAYSGVGGVTVPLTRAGTVLLDLGATL